MNITLKVWRQKNASDKGGFETYQVSDVSPDMSFLEMFDVLNEDLSRDSKDPIHFDHDCREGICGACSMYINGKPHGPKDAVTTCQLHMRSFKDGDVIVVEPWRSAAFPILKDLVVNRDSFDRIIQAGGYTNVNTGGVPDGNAIPIPKTIADQAMDAAQCIGCGACVAACKNASAMLFTADACKNASAMLFTAAKVSQLALLPQGQVERETRVEKMVAQMEEEGFGNCTNTGACSAVCPKEIGQEHIARLNREFLGAKASSNNL